MRKKGPPVAGTSLHGRHCPVTTAADLRIVVVARRHGRHRRERDTMNEAGIGLAEALRSLRGELVAAMTAAAFEPRNACISSASLLRSRLTAARLGVISSLPFW